MESFSLQPNEVILYKDEVIPNGATAYCKLILTNIHIATVTRTKRLFSKEEVHVLCYPVSDIKVYNGIPQIKQSADSIEIYLADSIISFQFETKVKARKFLSIAYELITGKSMTERSAAKVKDAMNLVDSTLGINTVNSIKSVVENGIVGSILHGFGKKPPVLTKSSALADTLSITKDLLNKPANTVPQQNEVKVENSFNGQFDALKKLKELLDSGIITQEEFDAKKKQIIGL